MYDDFYGLSGRPFQLTPDPAFYFESGTHRKALSYLGYGLAQAEGFIVVTGEVGAGKSTLVAHLMATIDRRRLTVAQIVTSALDASELVHVAAQAFGLGVAGKDKASALRAIEQFLQSEARAGRRCLLVVDEAQNLSVAALEELRMLSNFQLGSHPLLQIVLLGQPEFRDLLAQSPSLEQLRQRVIANHHLEAMEAAEVGPYIEHRLTQAGWSGNPAFEPQVYSGLATATGGNPRRINQVVARLLLLGAMEQRERIDAAMLDTVLSDLAQDAATPEMSRPAVDAPVSFPPQSARRVEAPVADLPDDLVGEIRAAFSERDALIVELQQAVVELSDRQHAEASAVPMGDAGVPPMLAALEQRLGAMESRLLEQEQTIRHTLTMLIDWIEDDPHRAAA
jgi:putative secretion ATPase (PEP-CTERM system associated)